MSPVILPFSTLADEEVQALLLKYRIGLTVSEARAISTMLGRDPTLTEATIWGIQGSEHCSYKSSRRFLKMFPTSGKHVILGPKEDSGIVAITDGPVGKRWGLVCSHESHNHPSQVVPYEGAATGVGGCVRDVVCMGARVIGSMDSLRLGDLQTDESRAIATEVIRGIAGYGNALGIPNLGGDTVFDSVFNKSCLVNVVSFGLIREDEIIHSYVQEEAGRVGYDIIVVGKATDRSGFGGASFASTTLREEDKEANSGAVQEPNPFLERHLLASTYALFDWLKREQKLDKVSFKDMGAGGNVCASVEQVAPVSMGATIDLDAIHTSTDDLPPEVIACAETQERLCWICHPSLTEHILHHYNKVWDLPSVAERARASCIGKVTTDPMYILRYKGEVVCSASSKDLTLGLQYVRETKPWKSTLLEPEVICEEDRITILGATFSLQTVCMALLSHPSYASKSRVFRHYDKNILGNTILEAGEADAVVLMPLSDIQSYEIDGHHPDWEASLRDEDRYVGVAVACGGNGRYGRISPYLQGVNAVVENVRNLACVGALPRAISDCLNYGNPEDPKQLWSLEQGIRGIADAAKSLPFDGEALPVISGNVSLYNVTPEGPIDPLANVCVMGTLPDARKAPSMQCKAVGSALFYIGTPRDECGGSAYYHVLETLLQTPANTLLGAQVPSPDFSTTFRDVQFVAEQVRSQVVLSAHDISEGGLLLALFEMTTPQRGIDVGLGISIDLDAFSSALRSDTLLFTETGAFVAEVAAGDADTFARTAKALGVAVSRIGNVTDSQRLTVRRGKEALVDLDLSSTLLMWKNALEIALQSK